MFGGVIGSIWSMAKEKLVYNGLEIMRGKFISSSDNVERNFKSLMARADDVEKDICTQEQQQAGKKRKREEVRVWFQDVKKVRRDFHRFKREEKSRGIVKRIIFGGDEATQLNARIRNLDDRSRVFGELVVGDVNTGGLPRPTSGLEGAAFQDNFQRIWQLLENDEVPSIGVHGMGGVGKSTLVEHINNQLLERNKCVYWVVVSQKCSIKMLQAKISRKLGLKLLKEDDEGARAGMLMHALSQRENFILILDDVWEHINLVKVGVPLSMEGCKLMMTSRSLNVCREMNCQEKIAVNPLNKDEGWSLFLKNLGQDATSSLTDPTVKGIAKRMVETCDGLPLGIITLAGAMSGVTDIQEWRHALKVLKESAMGHEWMEEKVFPVLKYSFDRLNPKDQRCFLYCSLYPEDYIISKEEWFNAFITEDLANKTSSRAAQRDEAHSVMTRLVKVSLLESVSDSYKGECVKMHDLVRAMAHKITEGKTMVIAGHYSARKQFPIEDEWTKDLEKVSLMKNQIEEIPLGISPNCPKLTTLLLQNNYPLKRIATSFFTKMCGLRTLDLSETQIVELPDSVSDLVDLTSLLLRECTKLQYVPCVRKLKELTELDLSFTAIEDVPQGLEELVNIRSLSINRTDKLSRKSLKLRSPWLQLLRLPNWIQPEFVEGGERLEVFEGWLKHMSDFNRLVASKLDGVSYRIWISDSGGRYGSPGKLEDGERRLSVYKYDVKDRVESELPTEYITHLKFSDCKSMSKCLLDELSNPKSLQELTIAFTKGIECLMTYDQYKAPQGSKSRLQALEVIELRHLWDFAGVIHNLEVEAATLDPPPPSVFSSLRRLTIFQCKNLKKLGLPNSVIEQLEHISIHECDEIEEIIQVAATNEDDDGALFVSFPNLKHLSLVALPCLESFCDVPVICSSIETVEFKDCPRLEEPSLNRGTPDSYRPLYAGTSSSVVMKKWWEINLFRQSSR